MECLHQGNRIVKVIGQLLDLHPAPPCDFTVSIKHKTGIHRLKAEREVGRGVLNSF
jgi:hypothetical protein